MKRDILRDADYRYDFDRAMYVNRAAKKAFSLEFIDDHTEEDLVSHIRENSSGNGWRFYFNVSPSESEQRELERVLA